MSKEMVRTVVIFTSDLFDTSWPEAGGDPNSPPLGRDAAIYFQRRLTALNLPPLDGDPFMEECGWYWRVSMGDSLFGLFLHWAPIGTPPRDAWVIQTESLSGCLAWLTGKRAVAEVMPLCDVLHRIIESESRIANVRWLTGEEFAREY